ncbi:MAG: RsmD family RNA methyltransferase, partial [Myxococcota bacterium]
PHPVADRVRPTSARVREAMFSLVGHDLSGLRVLDAFGGSGLLGLEAWSRGASVVVVEQDPSIARTIAQNVAEIGASVEVRVGDVRAVGPTLGGFDVVLIDPPYREAPGPILASLAGCARSVVVLESDAAVAAPDAPPGWALDRRRTYGGSALAVYRSG